MLESYDTGTGRDGLAGGADLETGTRALDDWVGAASRLEVLVVVATCAGGGADFVCAGGARAGDGTGAETGCGAT